MASSIFQSDNIVNFFDGLNGLLWYIPGHMNVLACAYNFPSWFYYVIVSLLGAILGSFANVCIVRLPKDESIILPSSHCILCGAKLRAWENIPILSFIFLKGKCGHCRGRISAEYPLVEIVSTLFAVLTWWYFLDPAKFLAYYLFFILPLIIVTFIDIHHRIIPDEISISGIFVGVLIHTVFASKGVRLATLGDSVLGIIIGGGALWLVAYLYEKLKKQEGLGGGDIKLIAMLGAFFGWRAAIFILLISSVLGSVIGLLVIIILRKDTKYAIPFGPFLAVAGILQLFVGDWLIDWYMKILSKAL